MNEKEIIDLIKKHIKIVENPETNAIDIYIRCNGMYKLTLSRSYIRCGFGKHHDWEKPTQDTIDLQLFKEAFTNE